MNNDNMPFSVEELFEKKEAIYSYYSDEVMDNYQSMEWFVNDLGLTPFIQQNDGTQITIFHYNYPDTICIDAGGLGDFYSHKFDVSIVPPMPESTQS